MAGMGRKQINAEVYLAKFPEGTLDRIDKVLADKEPRAAFVREAVDREIKRRERRSKS
jgi:hypothetical protein